MSANKTLKYLITPSLLLLIGLNSRNGSAYEFNMNQDLTKKTEGSKEIYQEKVLKSPYVGRYQFKSNLYPGISTTDDEDSVDTSKPETQLGYYFMNRLFTADIRLPGAPIGRYYVPDLQYNVVPSDDNGAALPLQPGIRLIPVESSEEFKYRIPTVPINIRQRYPTVVDKYFTDNDLSPNQRTFEEYYARGMLVAVQKYQTDNNETPVLTDNDIKTMLEANKEKTIQTDVVEEIGSKIAYGVDDRTAPLHMVVPHPFSDKPVFTSVKDLIGDNEKVETGVYHVSGFYRFDGVPKDSRRSMLSENSPVNLRMLFVRNGKNVDTPEAIESIKATQLNLSLWFMLYYENPESYAFSENYVFDDSYITNLEEVAEMARGWLDHDYVRTEFNAVNAGRIQKRFNTLMVPINKINDPKQKNRLTKTDVNTANNNIWELRTQVNLLYGAKTAEELETDHSAIWDISRKIEAIEGESLSTLVLTDAEKTKVKTLLDLLAKLQKGVPAAAAKLSYYKLLQNDPALAEYCNEGVKDQIDKGINIPLSHKWLKKIYPAADGDRMFTMAENRLCQIQVLRSGDNLTAAQKKQLKDDPCSFPNTTKLSALEPQLDKMVPVFTLPRMVRNAERFNETNPLIPLRDASGKPVGYAADVKRDYDVRLIGNSLAYGPQTTLDIIANFITAYLPFHKAGAASVTAVTLGFLPEHFRRTGIDSQTFLAVASKILNLIYEAEARIVVTSLAGLPADQQAAKVKEYQDQTAYFFNTILPKQIDEAIAAAAQQNSGENDVQEHQRFQGSHEGQPKVSGAQVAEFIYTNGVSDAVAKAQPYSTEEMVEFTGHDPFQKQFTFGVFKKTMASIRPIIEKANHEYPTNPANPMDALANGTLRVKFYHQPGINSLDHMGLINRNPNVLFVDVGTVTSVDQIDTKDPATEKKYYDQQIEGGLLHQQVLEFVKAPASESSVEAYRKSLYKNSLIGRPWSDEGAL